MNNIETSLEFTFLDFLVASQNNSKLEQHEKERVNESQYLLIATEDHS